MLLMGNASGADEVRSYARVYQDGTMKDQSYQPTQYFLERLVEVKEVELFFHYSLASNRSY